MLAYHLEDLPIVVLSQVWPLTSRHKRIPNPVAVPV